MVWKVFTLRFCTTLIFSRMFLKYYRYRYKVNTKKLGTYAEHTIKFISSLYQSLFSNYHRKTEKRENRQSPLYTSLVASTCVAEPGSSLHRVVGTWTQLSFADTPHGAFIVSEINTPFWFRFFRHFFVFFVYNFLPNGGIVTKSTPNGAHWYAASNCASLVSVWPILTELCPKDR